MILQWREIPAIINSEKALGAGAGVLLLDLRGLDGPAALDRLLPAAREGAEVLAVAARVPSLVLYQIRLGTPLMVDSRKLSRSHRSATSTAP